MCVFELRDAAPCVAPTRILPRDLSECKAGGMGVALIDQLMDKWHIEPLPSGKGNLLVMQKYLKSKAENEP